MWLFLKYGFYSVACASKEDGSLDRDRVMIRARRAEHLRNLQERFPALAGAEILALRDSDYGYRLVVDKAVWLPVLVEAGEEQTWSNFKNEAAKYQGREGTEYVHALHQVWGVMARLQRG